MGTLDQPTGSTVKRQIEVVDLTGKTAAQIKSAFNDNYGAKGWRIVQIIVLGGAPYLIAEREV